MILTAFVKWTVVVLEAYATVRAIRCANDPSRDKPATPGVYAFAAVLSALLALGVGILL